MSLARRKDLAMLALGVLVILVDQLTKSWIVTYFAGGHPPVPLLGQVLELQYLQNRGVAFSLFEGDALKFLLIAVALGVIGYLYWQAREAGSLLLKLSFGLILGGAVSNLFDRLSHQYVVDFIHFQIPHVFDWPIFNIADSAICVGVILLAALLWQASQQEADETSKASDVTENKTSLAGAVAAPRVPGIRVPGSIGSQGSNGPRTRRTAATATTPTPPETPASGVEGGQQIADGEEVSSASGSTDER